MDSYLIIETRDPLGSSSPEWTSALALELKGADSAVCLFLVENAVFAARSLVAWEPRDRLAGAGIEILADRFSLEERGIGDTELAEGVRPSGLDTIVDMLEAGRKALWL